MLLRPPTGGGEATGVGRAFKIAYVNPRPFIKAGRRSGHQRLRAARVCFVGGMVIADADCDSPSASFTVRCDCPLPRAHTAWNGSNAVSALTTNVYFPAQRTAVAAPVRRRAVMPTAIAIQVRAIAGSGMTSYPISRRMPTLRDERLRRVVPIVMAGPIKSSG